MNRKTVIVLLVSIVVLICCCTGAAVTGFAFYYYNVPAKITPVPSKIPGVCVITGCSGELCLSQTDAARKGVTTCQFKDSYACYDYAICEMQDDGVCGWTETPLYKSCMNDY